MLIRPLHAVNKALHRFQRRWSLPAFGAPGAEKTDTTPRGGGSRRPKLAQPTHPLSKTHPPIPPRGVVWDHP